MENFCVVKTCSKSTRTFRNEIQGHCLTKWIHDLSWTYLRRSWHRFIWVLCSFNLCRTSKGRVFLVNFEQVLLIISLRPLSAINIRKHLFRCLYSWLWATSWPLVRTWPWPLVFWLFNFGRSVHRCNLCNQASSFLFQRYQSIWSHDLSSIWDKYTIHQFPCQYWYLSKHSVVWLGHMCSWVVYYS